MGEYDEEEIWVYFTNNTNDFRDLIMAEFQPIIVQHMDRAENEFAEKFDTQE